MYEGAIYMRQGRDYLCTRLDLHACTATVRRATVKYYTAVHVDKEIAVQGGRAAYQPRYGLQHAGADLRACARPGECLYVCVRGR